VPGRAGAGGSSGAVPGRAGAGGSSGVVPGRAGAGGSSGAARGGAGGAGVVTLRCGRWRVTALPLASIAVRPGEHVRAGTAIGRVGTMAGHTGLHLGVRRADDRFAYVDPLPLLAAPSRPPVGALPREGPRGARPAAEPARDDATPSRASPAATGGDLAPSRASPAAIGGELASSRPARSRAAPRAAEPGGRAAGNEDRFARPRAEVRVPAGGLAPWPAWVGLALLGLGGVGGGVRIRVRRARARAGAAVPSAP
jgi:hypothetical protein